MSLRLLTMTFLYVLLSFQGKAQFIGPTSASSGTNINFTFQDDLVYPLYNWTVTNGTIVSKGRSGQDYNVTVKFNCTTPQTLTFLNGTTIIASAAISITGGVAMPSTPASTFTYQNNCGSSIITRNGNPPSGISWYWQTSSTGTSTAMGAGTTLTVTGVGPYYLRALNNSCATSWSKNSLATSSIPIKVIPTAAAANQSICSGQSTAISITNPNNIPGTTFTWTVTAVGVSGTSGGSGSSIAQILVASGNINGTATYTVTPSNNGCVGNPVTVIVTVKPLPNVMAPGQNLFSGNLTSIGITNPNSVAGTTFSWNAIPSGVSGAAAGSGTTIAQLLNHTGTSTSTATVTYTITPSANGCTGIPITTLVTLTPVPVIAATNQGHISLGAPVTLDAGAGYSTYSWKNSQNEMMSTSQTMSTSIPDTYTITITKVGIYGIAVASSIVKHQWADLNENFVATTTLLVDNTTTVAAINNLTVDQVTQQIEYVDGLGRPLQRITTQGSPLKKDMVQAVWYDNLGRPSRKYLPFVSTETTGRIKQDPLNLRGSYAQSAQYLFYNNGPGDMVADDTHPYAETIYEDSPLGRTKKEGAPGLVWQPDQLNEFSSLDHTTRYAYETNDSLEVVKWTYAYPTTGFIFGKISAGTPSEITYYAPGQLVRIRTKDENGNERIEYKDKLGRTILKRSQAGNTNTISDTNYATTHYIYSGAGSLVCIIPPEATARLAPEYFNAAEANRESFLKRWAFRFSFDDRKHMIRKQLPGAEPVYMVYDQRDRLVMMQDGNQRLTNQWLFTKYDNLNRQVITGLYTHATSVDQTAMAALIGGTSTCEVYNGNPSTHGYTNNAFPNVTSSFSVLTVSYYDDYRFKSLTGGLNYLNTDIPGQAQAEFSSVVGQVTGTKFNILGSSGYVYAIKYFDGRYRVIQAITQNHKGGYDRISSTYDFPGRVLESKTTHNNGTTTQRIRRKFKYDHASRLTQVRHAINSQPEILLFHNKYNELGQLVDKKLHSTDNAVTFRQSTDRRYNIRGWLTSINNTPLNSDGGITDDDVPAQDTKDLFGMELAYDRPITGVSTTGDITYNGNISAMRWSANLGISLEKERGYRFSYDRLNRLTTSNFSSKTGGTWTPNGKFDETGLTYDLNGNIRTLVRKSFDYDNLHTTFTMDNLSYSYHGSNNLVNITDAGNKSLGFTEQDSGTGNEYGYDANGNMITDQNDGITSITYNHLNLPVKVNKGPANYLTYTYDATGKKLSQQVFGAAAKTTDYLGEFVYEGGVLQFINHEEGRIVMTGSLPEYQYYLKDHLGNIRTTFTTGNTTDINLANYEPGNQSSEFSKFTRVDHVRRVNAAIFDHTNGLDNGYAERLNGTVNEKYGIARSISVAAGDLISAEVFAKYVDTNATNWTPALTSLIGQISSASLGVVADGANYGNGTSGFGFAGLLTQSSNGAPKAYLNWLVFDKNFAVISEKCGYRQITTASREYGQDVAHERLYSPTIDITEPGYVYIYLSNEETIPVEVYFDDFTLTQVKTPVVSTAEYYPFGLPFNEFNREGAKANPFSFNGKEIQDELDLKWLDYGKRMLNPKTGRWMVPDQMAEVSPDLTPYRYGYNNPIRFVDPNGMYETDGHFWTVYLVATILNLSNAGSIAQWTEAPDNWMSQDGDSHYGTKTYITPSWRGPVHSLTGGTPDYERWLSVTGVMQSNNDVSLGVSLHRLGDSFAHTIPGKDKMFGTDVGHLFYGHSPDKIKNRPELYLQYVNTLFETLALKFGKSGGTWDMFTFDYLASAGLGTSENAAILETEIAIRTGKKTFSVEGNQKDTISNYMKYRNGTNMGVNVVHTTSDVYEFNASSGEFVKTGTRNISVVTFDND